ncbi:hypothetical protein K7887_11415 [Sutcliffiella horikoshii]|uniref:hypothetical protein n=1 Tax=Sutcliffiella horikoshii TaxID=79883 RepID=UPI001CBBFA8B|nr:hypothetical protein [Sutcliffiella horikoshii]UAL45563.1 hypothetical protein K7887_11415 [Sutcliffiella horikoshii]
MRLIITVLFLLLVITGCDSKSEKELLENLVSKDPDFYMLYAVPEIDKEFIDVQEVQDYYNLDFNKLLSNDSLDTLYFGTYLWLMPVDNYKTYKYIETLEFDDYPAFVIFDSEQLVFSSSNIEEVEHFLSTREETNGIKLRKEQEIDYYSQ